MASDIALARIIAPRQVSSPQVRTARGEGPNASASLWRAEDEKSTTLNSSPNDFLVARNAGVYDFREPAAIFLIPPASMSADCLIAYWDGFNDIVFPFRSITTTIVPTSSPIADGLASGATDFLGSTTFFPGWSDVSTLPTGTGIVTLTDENLTINGFTGKVRARIILPKMEATVANVALAFKLEQRPDGGAYSEVGDFGEPVVTVTSAVMATMFTPFIDHTEDASYRIAVSRDAGAALTLTLAQPFIEYELVIDGLGTVA